jgi:hypothetical protein
MSTEQRLKRVERVLVLFANEGRRWRVLRREQDEKINILIQCQIETTEQINKTNKQLEKTDDQLKKTDDQIKKFTAKVAASHAIHEKEMAELRRSQKLTDKALRAFIDSMRKARNGNSSD